jgi:hypothetical protein
MGVKEQFLEAVKTEQKTVYYTVSKSGLLKKNAKIKFIIKSLFPKDFLDKGVREEIMKEVSRGQTLEEAGRVVSEKLKKDFVSYKNDEIAKMMIQKGVLFPKIVDKEENLAEDELPYKMLQIYWEIKLFLIKEIAAISPMFQGVI